MSIHGTNYLANLTAACGHDPELLKSWITGSWSTRSVKTIPVLVYVSRDPEATYRCGPDHDHALNNLWVRS